MGGKVNHILGKQPLLHGFTRVACFIFAKKHLVLDQVKRQLWLKLNLDLIFLAKSNLNRYLVISHYVVLIRFNTNQIHLSSSSTIKGGTSHPDPHLKEGTHERYLYRNCQKPVREGLNEKRRQIWDNWPKLWNPLILPKGWLHNQSYLFHPFLPLRST